MACPNGYIDIDGNCVYVFGNEDGIAPDGTPLNSTQSNPFWKWLQDNLPEILIGVGTVWQAGQGNHPNPGAGSPANTPTAPKTPIWIWMAIGLLVVVVLVLLLRH